MMAAAGEHPVAHQRAGENLGEITGLLVTLDWREGEFDRPFGNPAFGFEWIGQTQTANDEIGFRLAATIDLDVDILALRNRHPGR